MQIITKQYKVFEFKELSKEAKEEAINKWYEGETYDFLEDDILNEMGCIDEHNIFEDVSLCYSLSYSQGDGLSFKSTVNLKNFLNNIYSKKLPQYKKNAMCEYIYSVGSNRNNGHYCYSHKNDIVFDENYQDGIERKHLSKLWDNILSEITEYYLDMCNQLEKYGYSTLEYRMTDDEFSEHCNANEYNFFEDGNMANL